MLVPATDTYMIRQALILIDRALIFRVSIGKKSRIDKLIE